MFFWLKAGQQVYMCLSWVACGYWPFWFTQHSDKLAGEDRLYHVCQSWPVEDEHHFLLGSTTYAHTTSTLAVSPQVCPHTELKLLFSTAATREGIL